MQPIIQPTPKQHEAWQKLQDTTTKYLLFGGGAGGGKTWLYCEWLLTCAYFYPQSRGFMARNELKRLMNSTFVTWSKVCAHHKIPSTDWTLDGKYNVIRFKNGSTIDLLDVAYKPTDPLYERFGSLEYSHGFGEEVAEWDFLAFDVLKSRIGRHRSFLDGVERTPPVKFGLSCNPSLGWVKRVFFDPAQKGILQPDYAFIQSLYSDNPYTSDSYGEQLASMTNEANKQRLMFGNWNYEDSLGTLFKYDNVTDIFTNVPQKGEKYMIVDVARFGDDSTRISLWDGLYCYRREVRRKQDTSQTARDIRDISIQENIPYSHILIDEIGVGAGVVDQLRGTKGYNGASQPLPTRTALRRQVSYQRDVLGNNVIHQFANLKAQCVYKLAELIEKHQISCSKADDENAIIEEIIAHKQKNPEKESKIQIIPKEEIKESIGRSPDIADTFIMRMWFELIADATTSTTLHKDPVGKIRPTAWSNQQSYTTGE